MKVAVFGTGYVGLVQAAGLAELGNQVIGVDIDENKVKHLSQGISPIYEPGIEEMLRRNLKEGRLRFTTDAAEGLADAEVIFIAVGTPSADDGRADLQYVEAVARTIGERLTAQGRTDAVVVVNKSTVPIGTGDMVGRLIGERYRGEVSVVSNPEFLREGAAVTDFMKPDRIVIGSDNGSSQARNVMNRLYAPLGAPILHTDVKTAELIKYASNSFLATSISFINSVAELAESVGADITKVSEGMKLDGRIGQRAFLAAGCGYGGSCFPKDVQALITMAHDAGVHVGILEQVEDVNAATRRHLVGKIKERLGSTLRGSTIAVWGLAFKPKTDDMRAAPAVTVIKALQQAGATVQAFDPVAQAVAEGMLSDVTYARSALQAAEGADCLVIMTEWDDFRALDLRKLKGVLAQPNIVDGRNVYDLDTMRELGFNYISVGRPAVHAS